MVDLESRRPKIHEDAQQQKTSPTAHAVLVVDDEPAILRLLSVALRGSGYDVLTAADAETAWDIVKSVKPRLILSDIRMPGMDGLELARRIRVDPDLNEVYIYLMSAYSPPSLAPSDGFISKPFDIEEVMATVGAFMEESEDS